MPTLWTPPEDTPGAGQDAREVDPHAARMTLFRRLLDLAVETTTLGRVIACVPVKPHKGDTFTPQDVAGSLALFTDAVDDAIQTLAHINKLALALATSQGPPRATPGKGAQNAGDK